MRLDTGMEVDNQLTYISKDQTSLLKGIAIFLVLFGHIGENIGWLPSLPLGTVGVYIFLFLSGYGLMRSTTTNGIAGYWAKRIKKVYLPYIIALAFCAILSVGFLHKISIDFIRYLVLWKVPLGEYWYLRIQIEWYIAFFLIWNMKTRRSLDMKWTLVLMALADILIVSANLSDRKFVWTFGAFVIGGGIGHYGIQLINKHRDTRLTIGFAAVIMIAGVIKKTPWVEAHELGVTDTICQLLIVFCAAALVIFYAEKIVNLMHGLRSVLLVLGGYSYEIYLTHSIYIEMLKNAAEKSVIEKLLVIVLFLILTFASTFSMRFLMKAING